MLIGHIERIMYVYDDQSNDYLACSYYSHCSIQTALAGVIFKC